VAKAGSICSDCVLVNGRLNNNGITALGAKFLAAAIPAQFTLSSILYGRALHRQYVCAVTINTSIVSLLCA